MAIAAAPIALAVVGAATSVAQAQANNRAVRRSMEAAARGAEEQSRQVVDQSEVEAMKRRNEADMIRARLRVAGADAGIGDAIGGLMSQANYDEALNREILDRNTVNQQRLIHSGLQADLAALKGRAVNAVLAGISGGLSGATTGLQISSLVRGIGNLGPSSAKPEVIIGGSQMSNPDIPVLPAYRGAFT